MAEERAVTIVIRGKNLTQAEFAAARKDLAGVDDQAKKTSLTASTLGTAFKALGAAFTVGAITSAIRSYADLTGQLTDMSAKTGIGVEALQRLKYAAEQNGGSLEQVTGAVSKLGAKLAGGDKSAVGALDALGLSFKEIRGMAPDKAFTTIADSIAKIPDPMAQSKLAMDLFGKSGADLLPMMKGNLSETADAASRLGIVLSEDAVRAGDEFGDTMTTLGAVGKSIIAQVLEPMIPVLTTVAQWLGEKLPGAVRFIVDALTVGLGRAFLDAKIWMNEFILGVAEGVNKIPLLGEKIGFSAQMMAGLRSNVTDAKGALAIFTEQSIATSASNDKAARTISTLNLKYGDNEKAVGKAAAAAEKARLESTIWGSGLSDFDHLLGDHNITIGEYVTQAYSASDATADMWDQMFRLSGQVQKIKPAAEEALPPFIALLANLKTELNGLTTKDHFRALVAPMKAGLSDVLQSVPGTLARAFEGGGNWLGAAKSIGSQFGSVIGKNIGASFKALGDLGGPIGSAIGSLAGPLIGKIAGLFTSKNTQEVKGYNVEIGKVRDTLLATYGPLDELEAKAQTVGMSFKAAWGHEGKAGMEAMNTLAKEFKLRWDDLNGSLANSRTELDAVKQRGSDLGYTFDASGNLVKVSTEKMSAVAQKYGLDLKALGPSFDQAGLRTRMDDVINGFTLMDKGGTSTGTILSGMKDEINAIVNDSIKFGVDIPANMQPWIANLIETGQLTDANGVKITDMAAIKFGAPVQTEFEKISSSILTLIASIQTLVDRISGIATAAASIPQVPAPWDGWGDPPSYDGLGGGNEGERGGGFARGTFGTTGIDFPDFGSGTRTVLHGRESVTPYADRVETAKRWLGGAAMAASVATAVAPAPNVYIVNDFTGARQVSEGEFKQIQARLDGGGLQVPARAISARGR